jgi:hypothetical protein
MGPADLFAGLIRRGFLLLGLFNIRFDIKSSSIHHFNSPAAPQVVVHVEKYIAKLLQEVELCKDIILSSLVLQLFSGIPQLYKYT